jgi:3-hydroxyacyl-[acyl-carrier-protein] dehydratase
MKELYSINIISIQDNRHTAEVKFNPAHAVFKGHFPGKPVVPGVVLLEIVADALSQIIKKEMNMNEASVVKFLHPVDPGIHPMIMLECSIVEENNEGIKANFRFYVDDVEIAKIRGIWFSYLP